MTGLYEQVFGECTCCGFYAVIVGGLEPVQMIGHNPASNGTGPEIVLRYRCRDHAGCERRQRDFQLRPWATG